MGTTTKRASSSSPTSFPLMKPQRGARRSLEPAAKEEGEDLRVRGQVAVQAHRKQLLGGKETLVRMGYLKMVQREDERQAAMAGLMTKQLTQPGIERHLADFGVDAESASHTQINQLSGGMKVKVVLAAAMWQNPHVLILDEPTNYLDR